MVVPVFSHPSAGLTICDTWDVRIVTVKCWNRVSLSSAMNTESSLPLAILISLPPTPGWESPKYLFTTILSHVSHIFCQKLSNFYILRYIGYHSLIRGLPIPADWIFLPQDRQWALLKRTSLCCSNSVKSIIPFTIIYPGSSHWKVYTTPRY